MGLRLFQYWDAPSPPAEVARWIEGFASLNPELDHTLMDERSASAFIRRWFGAAEQKAFLTCAVPAMQADLIRLCVLIIHGGVYVDADNQCLKPLDTLLQQAPHGMAFSWLGLVNNGFLFLRQPHDPFLEACLQLSLANVYARRFRIEFTATGPGVLNAIRGLIDPASLPEVRASFDNPVCRPWGFDQLLDEASRTIAVTPSLRRAFEARTIWNALAAGPWIGAEQPAYKQGGQHWPNWTGDIYRDVADGAG